MRSSGVSSQTGVVLLCELRLRVLRRRRPWASEANQQDQRCPLRSMTASLLLVDVVLRTTALGGLPQGFGEGDETEFSAYPLAGVR